MLPSLLTGGSYALDHVQQTLMNFCRESANLLMRMDSERRLPIHRALPKGIFIIRTTIYWNHFECLWAAVLYLEGVQYATDPCCGMS